MNDRHEREARLIEDITRLGRQSHADGMARGRETTIAVEYDGFTFWQIFTVGFFAGAVATQMYRIASVVARFCLGWS